MSNNNKENKRASTQSALEEQWRKQQNELKMKLITEDDNQDFDIDDSNIKYIGGCDISFFKGNNVDAVASLIVVESSTLQVVYESYKLVQLTQPYIAGFLAFREVDHLLGLWNELKDKRPDVIPQVLMLDGNGILHPRSFGIACHLGVLIDTPTIGVAKNLLVVDGLDAKIVKQQTIKEAKEHNDVSYYTKLIGNSGKIWGGALLMPNQSKPIYVSIGHLISLDTAVRLVKKCQLTRIPEPIRQADLRSRQYVNCTLLVKNINNIDAENESALRTKFGVYGNIRGVHVYNNDNEEDGGNCSSYFAFVTFYNKKDATKAMKGIQYNEAAKTQEGRDDRITWDVEFATQPKGDPAKKKSQKSKERA